MRLPNLSIYIIFHLLSLVLIIPSQAIPIGPWVAAAPGFMTLLTGFVATGRKIPFPGDTRLGWTDPTSGQLKSEKVKNIEELSILASKLENQGIIGPIYLYKGGILSGIKDS